MKRILLSLVATAIITANIFAQAPDGFKYQAVVRDAANLILANQAIGMRMTLQQASIGGTAIYTEIFAITTNEFGLVNLTIGTGTSVDDFATIDWSAGPYFIETAIDITGGTTYEVMGTSQLMSVPYALHAKTAESVRNDLVDDADADPSNEIQAINRTGTTVTLSNGGGTFEDSVGVYSAGTGIDITGNVVSSVDATYTIGLWPELGGYVFWISADGKHGLVAETVDQGTNIWYEAQNLISNPSNHSVMGQNFRDWRAPSKHELNEMYLHRLAIGGFANYFYWSSTENGSSNEWGQNFNNGYQGYVSKGNSNYVRAVRAF